jgi:hypothetical protein
MPNNLFLTDTQDLPQVLDSNYRSIQALGPVGTPTLTLTPSTYSTSTSLTLRVSPDLPPNFRVVQISVEGSTNSADVVTLSQGSLELEVRAKGSGYAAFGVAQTPNSTISAQEYQALGYRSNAVVVKFIGNPKASLDTMVKAQVSNYGSLSSIPLGSGSGLSGILSTLGKVLSDLRDPSRESRSSDSVIRGNRQDSTARINGLSSAIADVHLKGEFDVLSGWVKKFTDDDSFFNLPESLEPYRKAMQDSLESLVQTQETRATDNGAGNEVDKTSANRHIQAANLQLTSGTVLDLNSPSIQSNSEHHVLQAKNLHTQAYVSQSSSVNSWDRTEKTKVMMQQHHYLYSEESSTHLAANSVTEVGDQTHYSDRIRLQVGQFSEENISDKTALTGPYGSLEAVIRQDLTVQTIRGLLALRSALEIYGLAQRNCYLLSRQNSSLMASQNQYCSAGESLVLAAGATLAAEAPIVGITAFGPNYIQGSPVLINSGGSAPYVVDLDTQAVVGYAGISTPLPTTSPEEDPITPSPDPREFPKLQPLLPYEKVSAPKALGHQSNGLVSEAPLPTP